MLFNVYTLIQTIEICYSFSILLVAIRIDVWSRIRVCIIQADSLSSSEFGEGMSYKVSAALNETTT
jgi:hypothetical protein